LIGGSGPRFVALLLSNSFVPQLACPKMVIAGVPRRGSVAPPSPFTGPRDPQVPEHETPPVAIGPVPM
jgi:hypothetical protein